MTPKEGVIFMKNAIVVKITGGPDHNELVANRL